MKLIYLSTFYNNFEGISKCTYKHRLYKGVGFLVTFSFSFPPLSFEGERLLSLWLMAFNFMHLLQFLWKLTFATLIIMILEKYDVRSIYRYHNVMFLVLVHDHNYFTVSHVMLLMLVLYLMSMSLQLCVQKLRILIEDSDQNCKY